MGNIQLYVEEMITLASMAPQVVPAGDWATPENIARGMQAIVNERKYPLKVGLVEAGYRIGNSSAGMRVVIMPEDGAEARSAFFVVNLDAMGLDVSIGMAAQRRSETATFVYGLLSRFGALSHNGDFELLPELKSGGLQGRSLAQLATLDWTRERDVAEVTAGVVTFVAELGAAILVAEDRDLHLGKDNLSLRELLARMSPPDPFAKLKESQKRLEAMVRERDELQVRIAGMKSEYDPLEVKVRFLEAFNKKQLPMWAYWALGIGSFVLAAILGGFFEFLGPKFQLLCLLVFWGSIWFGLYQLQKRIRMAGKVPSDSEQRRHRELKPLYEKAVASATALLTNITAARQVVQQEVPGRFQDAIRGALQPAIAQRMEQDKLWQTAAVKEKFDRNMTLARHLFSAVAARLKPRGPAAAAPPGADDELSFMGAD